MVKAVSPVVQAKLARVKADPVVVPDALRYKAQSALLRYKAQSALLRYKAQSALLRLVRLDLQKTIYDKSVAIHKKAFIVQW